MDLLTGFSPAIIMFFYEQDENNDLIIFVNSNSEKS